MDHPLIQQRQSLLYYFFIWGLIALLQMLLLKFILNLEWKWAAADGFVFNFLFAVLGLSYWYPCRYISLEQNNVFKILTNHSLASVIASFIWLALAYIVLIEIISPDEGYRQFFKNTLPWRVSVGVLLYFILIAFYYLLIYYQNFHERAMRETELKALVKEAELKSLKFQINPHFIFNSLNSINSLIHSSPEQAGAMTVKLAEFLRSTLAQNEVQTINLYDELKIAKLYLDIEKVRFGEKIRFVEEINQQCYDDPLPSMILQPLFENAVKHGVYESLEPVTIKISAEHHNQYLKITVENNYDPQALPRKGEGVGLQNISRRLKNIYNRSNLLVVEKEEEKFRVILYIPVESE
ncbi:MAG: sensor histidine kinase [Calditrichia bacterium]